MTNKIFRSIFTVSVSVLLVTLLIITDYTGHYFDSVQQKELQDELELAAVGTEQLGSSYLQSLYSDNYRLTWIARDGSILFDTDVKANTMENHINREEVQEALKNGHGSSHRYSSTLTEKTLYESKRLSDGTVLRISVSYVTAARLLLGMLQPILIIFAMAAVLSVLLAIRMAKRIIKPINDLDLEHPLENDTYAELSPLLHRIHTQHQQIEKQMTQLRLKQHELHEITAQMQEGLVLLNDRDVILSINPAAKQIFKAEEDCVGKDFLTVDRSPVLSEAMHKASENGHSDLRMEREGREYQIHISKTNSETQRLGSVLLIFDVTEQANAERSRQEFTANVSHELKTPLQSISGSAELIENGLVRPEDMTRFAHNIRKESKRLVHLIDDIIRLSQLDEGAAMPTEAVDLAEMTEDVFSVLQAAAAEKQIALHLSGKASVQGVRRLLFELLYNLCDNAIKYNVQDGTVQVTLDSRADGAVLIVSDTGIGIPKAQQSRVFERFYRVDKSHSKQSGGTGLGLSIVKHAVQYHHGKIELESTEGQGTTVTVTLSNS